MSLFPDCGGRLERHKYSSVFLEVHMKYSPDAYLLHESNRLITFNIRVKVVLKEDVDGAILKTAAEKVFRRFPYYSKQIHIDEDGGIDLIPNPRTIRVHPVSAKRTYLFSEEVNYQPCSIEYEGSCMYFNMYHGMCGGCGTFRWIKATVYEYVCARYGVHPDPGSTFMVDMPISEEEYAFPKLQGLPEDAPIGSINKDNVWFPGLEYLFGFCNLAFGDSVHYEFQIPKAEMMKFVSENDGSPLSVIAAIMAKALRRALPKNELPFRIETSHNYRAEVGCPETHHDLLSHVFYFIPRHMQDWPIHKICTVIRGSTILQTQPEYAYDTLRRFYAYTDGVDGVKGLKEKKKYASQNSHRKPDVHNSVIVNYMGREDWGGLTEYVERVHIITDAHLLFEITDVGDHFCFAFMQMNKSTKYMDQFFRILEEEGIPYRILGVFQNHLPISRVESAPVEATKEA